MQQQLEPAGDQTPATPFATAIGQLMSRSEVRIVADREFEDICRLRYDAYKREDSLPANAPPVFSDRYDFEPNTTSYGLYVDHELAGSLRIHVIDRCTPTSPATSAFPEFVETWIEAGIRMIDGTRFVVDAAASRRYPNIAYLVARIAWLGGQFYDPDWIITTCRPEHQAFYRRVFGHLVVCPARPYPGLTKPQGLLRLDQRRQTPRVHARYPFFTPRAHECELLFGSGARLASVA